ncbi:MAG: hydrogenase 3 maturation endopeptidase HyCI [Candidatus Altiarchaeota archaeon]|nr:hydrogenase 3 maturation endopeptidase HyCI [Candidatus Altiarchaeota archaeon]
MGKVCFVCVGNELSGDDGFGPYVHSLIEGRVHAIDASTFPEAFVGVIIEKRPERVVLLDAAEFGAAPGELHIIDPSTIEQSHFSTHRAPLKHFINSLGKEGIPVVLLCVQAKKTGLGEEMSQEVKTAAEDIAKKIIGEQKNV